MGRHARGRRKATPAQIFDEHQSVDALVRERGGRGPRCARFCGVRSDCPNQGKPLDRFILIIGTVTRKPPVLLHSIQHGNSGRISPRPLSWNASFPTTSKSPPPRPTSVEDGERDEIMGDSSPPPPQTPPPRRAGIFCGSSSGVIQIPECRHPKLSEAGTKQEQARIKRPPLGSNKSNTIGEKKPTSHGLAPPSQFSPRCQMRVCRRPDGDGASGPRRRPPLCAARLFKETLVARPRAKREGEPLTPG